MASPIAITPIPVRLCAKFDITVELKLVGTPPGTVKAKIRRVSSGLIELLSPIYIEHDQMLQMLCEGRNIQSRVAYCRKETEGIYDLAVRIDPDDYVRAEPRIAVDISTTLQILGSPGPLKVKIVDLSTSGVGLKTPATIAIGARVWVALGYSSVLGEVRHCAPTGQSYRAGIRLEKLVRRQDGNARTRLDLDLGSWDSAALANFERSVEEKQLSTESVVLSFIRPL